MVALHEKVSNHQSEWDSFLGVLQYLYVRFHGNQFHICTAISVWSNKVDQLLLQLLELQIQPGSRLFTCCHLVLIYMGNNNVKSP